MLAAVLLAGALAGQTHAGPIDYQDPKGRFELRLDGAWTKSDPDASCEASFASEDGAQLSIHVNAAAGASVEAAAAALAPTWSALPHFARGPSGAQKIGGRDVFVETATYRAPDPDFADLDQTIAVRLVHVLVGDTLVTIVLQDEPTSSGTLDLLVESVAKGLVVAAPASAAPPPKPTPAPIAAPVEPLAIDPRAPSLAPFPVTFAVPEGWRLARVVGGEALLVSSREAGILLVHAGLYDAFEPAYARASELLGGLGFRGESRDDPREDRLGAWDATTLNSSGADAAGRKLAARERVVLSGKGLGVLVLGFAAPSAITDLGPRIDEVARTLSLGEIAVDRDLAGKLVGEWHLVSGAGAASWQLAPDGTYRADGKDGAENGRYATIGGALVVTSQRRGSRVLDCALEGDRLRLAGATYAK
jgi:hypothetical protein